MVIAGSIKRKIITRSEDQEQAAFFRWMEMMSRGPGLKYYRLAFAIPNGGKRSKITAAIMKRTGTKPAIPDILWPVARGRYHGLFIEMKRKDSRGPTDAQAEMLGLLADQGYMTTVAFGCDEARTIVKGYDELGIPLLAGIIM